MLLSSVPISAIRAFEAAARTGSFRDAANELHLTPSAVSHAIRKLESTMSTTLFERSARSVRLTPAGEDFRSIIELLSVWGQRWGQGLLGPDDLDPQELVWSMRRQIDPAEIPAQGFVIRFDFRGLPKSNRSPRYWWLVLRPDDVEVCLKAPARNTDVVIAADLMTFTKVWLGYVGLAAAVESGKVSLNGPARAISTARRVLALSSQPTLKTLRFSAFPATDTLAV